MGESLFSWSPVISGAASLASSALGIDASRRAEERAYQRNLQMMKAQNDFNVNMWNRTNEYNAPSNQMKLLKEAGINPAVFDANGGTAAASEVTAASADVPTNTQIGELYKGLDPSDKVIQALSTDYQIQKLRTDIQYQKLLNRDFQNELSAREELMETPLSDHDIEYDHNGNPIVTVTPGYNSYQENRAMRRLQIGSEGYRQQLQADELEVYEAGMPFLKKMPQQQLMHLAEDIKAAALNNSLLQEDVELMRKYGISPHDKDGWQSFLKAILRNPDAITNVIDQFLPSPQAFHRISNRMRGYGYSHKNPRSGSW